MNVANVNSSDFKSRVLTADVNLVDLRFAVQYRYADPVKVLFQVRDPETTLREVSESAIREIVGQSTLDDVLVGSTRPKITQRTKELIQRTLDCYNTGITVTTVNLTDVQVPDAVIPSQRDANKALADQERFIKEAQAYANDILPVAQGAAARMQQEPRPTRRRWWRSPRARRRASRSSRTPTRRRRRSRGSRLYIETIESVHSRAHKVIDRRQGRRGGNMIYLPLDKLWKQQCAAGEPRAPSSAAAAASAVAPEAGPSRSRPRAGRALMQRARHVPAFIVLLALLLVAVHAPCSPVSETAARHPHAVRRDRRHAATSPGCTSSGPGTQVVQVRAPHPHAAYGRDLPHQRQPRPDRRLLHQVAGERASRYLPGHRRR